MSFNDYVQYLTQQITAFMDEPAEKRKERKIKKTEKPVYSTKWLGLLPFAFKTARKKTQ